MSMYRKKPLMVEAHKLDDSVVGYAPDGLAKWCGGRVEGDGVLIPTLEGNMLASVGDYIVKGIKGEFYPCKAEIFEASYEQVGMRRDSAALTYGGTSMHEGGTK